MKKFSLLVIAALLGIGCAHIPSQNQTTQAQNTLKVIGAKLGQYYAKHQKHPHNEAMEDDFLAIGMENPSSKQWEYRFFCYEDTQNCLIEAQHKIKNLNPGKKFLTLELEVKKEVPDSKVYVLFHEVIPNGHEENVYFSSSRSYSVDTKTCRKMNGTLDKKQNCFLK